MDKNTIITLRDASIYQQDFLVLQSVNLTIHDGEFAYLIGKTGSGKSSLLKTLYGALPLKKGKGSVAGFDLKTLDRHIIPKLRRQLGIVFQEFSLLTDRSVWHNLLFVLKATDWKDAKKMRDRILEVVEMVGLKDKLKSMPYELSGGEQQRICLLYTSPSPRDRG